MKKTFLVAAFPLILMLSGCCLFVENDDALILEIRADIVESIRPAMVDALDMAKDETGAPAYVDPYKTEKVNLLDQMVDSIDRVHPPVNEDGEPAPYVPAKLPWGN